MLGCAAFSSCPISRLEVAGSASFDAVSSRVAVASYDTPLDLSVPKWKVRQHWSGGSIVHENDAPRSDPCSSCRRDKPVTATHWLRPRIEIHISQNFYPAAQQQKRLGPEDLNPPPKKSTHEPEKSIGRQARERIAVYVRSQVRKRPDEADHVMEDDLKRLAATVQFLQDSGYYYGSLSWQDSVTLLQGSQVGTFLIRDSSDPRFLFSLSVQTERGAASVRIHYADGSFRLDADARLSAVVPKFESVSAMIDYYVAQWKHIHEKGQVWLDATGRTYSSVTVRSPLLKTCPSLQHLCRLSWNKTSLEQRNRWAGSLPVPVSQYLSAYPFQN